MQLLAIIFHLLPSSNNNTESSDCIFNSSSQATLFVCYICNNLLIKSSHLPFKSEILDLGASNPSYENECDALFIEVFARQVVHEKCIFPNHLKKFSINNIFEPNSYKNKSQIVAYQKNMNARNNLTPVEARRSEILNLIINHCNPFLFNKQKINTSVFLNEIPIIVKMLKLIEQTSNHKLSTEENELVKFFSNKNMTKSIANQLTKSGLGFIQTFVRLICLCHSNKFDFPKAFGEAIKLLCKVSKIDKFSKILNGIKADSYETLKSIFKSMVKYGKHRNFVMLRAFSIACNEYKDLLKKTNSKATGIIYSFKIKEANRKFTNIEVLKIINENLFFFLLQLCIECDYPLLNAKETLELIKKTGIINIKILISYFAVKYGINAQPLIFLLEEEDKKYFFQLMFSKLDFFDLKDINYFYKKIKNLKLKERILLVELIKEFDPFKSDANLYLLYYELIIGLNRKVLYYKSYEEYIKSLDLPEKYNEIQELIVKNSQNTGNDDAFSFSTAFISLNRRNQSDISKHFPFFLRSLENFQILKKHDAFFNDSLFKKIVSTITASEEFLYFAKLHYFLRIFIHSIQSSINDNFFKTHFFIDTNDLFKSSCAFYADKIIENHHCYQESSFIGDSALLFRFLKDLKEWIDYERKEKLKTLNKPKINRKKRKIEGFKYLAKANVQPYHNKSWAGNKNQNEDSHCSEDKNSGSIEGTKPLETETIEFNTLFQEIAQNPVFCSIIDQELN